MPNALRVIIHKSKESFEEKSIEYKPDHTSKTSAASLKSELASLIENLKETVRNDPNKFESQNILKYNWFKKHIFRICILSGAFFQTVISKTKSSTKN